MKKTGTEQQEFPLDSSIKELENLIADKSRIHPEDIPVLDEVVDPDLFDEDEPIETIIDWPDDEGIPQSEDSLSEDREQGFSQEQIEMLVGKMDERITGELDELVNILKSAIRESIMTEIKTQLESRAAENPGDSDDLSGSN